MNLSAAEIRRGRHRTTLRLCNSEQTSQSVAYIHGAEPVFFAYIGFDAVSTAAEECKDAARDIPRGIIGSLLVCAVFYVAASAILTGMVLLGN